MAWLKHQLKQIASKIIIVAIIYEININNKNKQKLSRKLALTTVRMTIPLVNLLRNSEVNAN